MQLCQLRGQRRERIEGGTGGDPGRRQQVGVRQRRWGLGQPDVPEVGAVHAEGGEPVGQPTDLAAELVRREPALAQLAGQRVGGRGEEHAGVGQLTEQPGHQHGVAGIVEFEFVDGQQPVAGQPLHRFPEAQRADQVGVLDEGAVGLRSRHRVPERCQQMGLADPEPAVQIHPGRLRVGGPAEPALLRRVGDRLRHCGERGERGLLRRFGWIGAVGAEPDGVEPAGRNQALDQLAGTHERPDVDQMIKGHEAPP